MPFDDGPPKGGKPEGPRLKYVVSVNTKELAIGFGAQPDVPLVELPMGVKGFLLTKDEAFALGAMLIRMAGVLDIMEELPPEQRPKDPPAGGPYG